MPHSRLVSAVRQLSSVRTLPAAMAVVRATARELTGSDGITVVLRDRDACVYADEEGIAPLWKGQRFAMSACVSGWVMNRGRSFPTSCDARVPLALYRSTFVRSMLMVPVRRERPIAAIGAYWAESHTAADAEVECLRALPDAAAVAFENASIFGAMRTTIARERTARAAAEQACRLKDDSLAIAAHELRTPVNAVLGYVRMLQNGVVPQERVEDVLGTIERNTRLQARLIDDLLDASRVATGTLRLCLAPADIREAVVDAVASVRPTADATGVTVHTSLCAPVVFPADAVRLRQIVWNLLQNAVKFSAPGGQIALDLRREAECVQLIVSDTGRGIAPEFLPHVFDPFRQAESASARASGGVGLGLALARHLAWLHGGSLTAASDGLNKGATFTLRLPLVVRS